MSTSIPAGKATILLVVCAVGRTCPAPAIIAGGIEAYRRQRNTTKRGLVGVESRFFFHESEQTYGYRRIHADLVDQGRPASAQTWCSRLHAAGRPGSLPASEAGSYYHPEPRILSSSLDLVKCDVTADKPAQKWVGDITYISTWEGFAYLSGRDGAATRRKSSGTRLLSICALNLLLML